MRFSIPHSFRRGGAPSAPPYHIGSAGHAVTTCRSALSSGATAIVLSALAAVAVSALRCDPIYTPAPQTLVSENRNVSLTSGTIFSVNGTRQICNPSISPAGDFTGCMLWLNFGGDLNVTVPPDMRDEYATDRANVRQHDRLTVSDTANTVRWFMMRDEMNIAGQIQDPEWSTHSDYIACLGDERNDDRWECYIVRLSDRAYRKLSENNLNETSTPHLWVASSGIPATAPSDPSYDDAQDGFADPAAVKSFFGTDSVVIAYAIKDPALSVHYIDYRSDDPRPVKLKKPAEHPGDDTESPLISPDGRWIVFNCISKGMYRSYLQRLDPDASPVLIADNAADPHWWVHPESGQLYIVYSVLTGDYFAKEDYADISLEENGALGATWKQEVRLASGPLPSHASFSMVSNPLRIVNLPFKGGMSADGRYLCTGYGYGFIIRLF